MGLEYSLHLDMKDRARRFAQGHKYMCDESGIYRMDLTSNAVDLPYPGAKT